MPTHLMEYTTDGVLDTMGTVVLVNDQEVELEALLNPYVGRLVRLTVKLEALDGL